MWLLLFIVKLMPIPWSCPWWNGHVLATTCPEQLLSSVARQLCWRLKTPTRTILGYSHAKWITGLEIQWKTQLFFWSNVSLSWIFLLLSISYNFWLSIIDVWTPENHSKSFSAIWLHPLKFTQRKIGSKSQIIGSLYSIFSSLWNLLIGTPL